MTMGLTDLLKKSIAFENSKKDVCNLKTHSRDALSLVIAVIQKEVEETEFIIESMQRHIDFAVDMAEGLEISQRETIKQEKAKLEDLLSWRTIFLAAWEEVNKK